MESLPIHGIEASFRRAVARGHVVVSAPTGSGKSTVVPTWCASELGRALVVEPRRVACRSLARYVSGLMDTPLGGDVGYVVRHDDRAGARVNFVTPGIALRMVQGGDHDPYPVVVLDEFHERTLELDLLLALLLQAGRHRLVVMSATLQAERLASFLGAEHLEAWGRQFPVTVAHAEGPLLPSSRQLAARVVSAVETLQQRPGDILVFLPGKGEIADCQAALAGRGDLEVVPLHAQLRPREQDRAFDPGPRRRVILATNVAETSVTLPRVGAVVDSGLVRQTRYRGTRGYLTLTSIATDSADQRTGRAGRLFPGHGLRLWSSEAILEPVTPPEIHREALPVIVLATAACGWRVGELRFLDPPKAHAVEAAERDLAELGALDEQRRITPLGRRLFAMPLDAHLGRILLEAEGTPVAQDAVDLVAAVASGRPLFQPGPRPTEGELDLRAAGCDATAVIAALRRGEPGPHRLRALALAEARRVAGQLRRLLSLSGPSPTARVDRQALARCVLRAVPAAGYVPRRRKRYLVWANGRQETELGRDTAVTEDARALAVVDTMALTVKGRRTVQMITCAIPCTAATLLAAGLGETRAGAVRLEKGRLVAEAIRSHAGLVLRREDVEPTGALARQAVVTLLLSGGLFGDLRPRNLERVAAHNLHSRLEGDGSQVELEEWLALRLDALGFESADDLDLLLAGDVTFPDLPAEARAWLDRHFPREIGLGDARYRVTYDVKAMEITLETTSGARRTPPSPTFLPPWPGWRVVHRDRSRVHVLRERR